MALHTQLRHSRLSQMIWQMPQQAASSSCNWPRHMLLLAKLLRRHAMQSGLTCQAAYEQ